MGDVSDGNCSMNNHNLYQQDFDSNNGDVSSVYGFINSHTSHNVMIQAPLRILVGMLKILMLVVNVVL